MAGLCPDAFPKGPRTGKTPVRGNISPPCIQIQLILARYACHASEKPRKAPLGNAPREHLAAEGRFRRPKPSDHARRTNLAALRWPCPCAGAPARATASRDRLSTAWPLPRGACPQRLANTRHLPIPVTCQYLSPANTRRSLHPLQPEASRRWASAAVIRLMARSPAKPRGAADRIISTGRPTTECCAEPGLDSRTVSKWAQNLRRGPQARPGLRRRCRKRPSKGRVPLGGTIGTPHPFPIAQKKPTPGINPRVSFICALSCIQPVRVSSCFTLGSFSAGMPSVFQACPGCSAAIQRIETSSCVVAGNYLPPVCFAGKTAYLGSTLLDICLPQAMQVAVLVYGDRLFARNNRKIRLGLFARLEMLHLEALRGFQHDHGDEMSIHHGV